MTSTEPGLSGRDWLLLPLIALASIAVLALSSERLARRIFSTSTSGLESCLYVDPHIVLRAKPNSVCQEKEAEGPLVEYRFNACGDRTGIECSAARPAGTYRIVMVGSSCAVGMMVPENETLAGRLPGDLSALTGRRVETYNAGMGGEGPHSVLLRFDEIVARRPDMILWVLTPFDVEAPSYVPPSNGIQQPAHRGLLDAAVHRAQMAFASRSLSGAAMDVIGSSRTALAIRHFVYQSQSQYVRSYLIDGLQRASLQATADPEWRQRLQEFENYAAAIEQRAHAAGIPFVAVSLPNRAQAAMISMGKWPAGYDPYQLNRDFRAVIERHGGIYVDILPGFRTIPNPEQYFFPVDGHPGPRAYAIFSGLLSRQLASGVIPDLRSAHPDSGAKENLRINE